MPFYYARDKKLFDKYGLDVEIIQISVHADAGVGDAATWTGSTSSGDFGCLINGRTSSVAPRSSRRVSARSSASAICLPTIDGSYCRPRLSGRRRLKNLDRCGASEGALRSISSAEIVSIWTCGSACHFTCSLRRSLSSTGRSAGARMRSGCRCSKLAIASLTVSTNVTSASTLLANEYLQQASSQSIGFDRQNV